MMVDGFGLDTVAKLTLAFKHGSNDYALSVAVTQLANSIPVTEQKRTRG